MIAADSSSFIAFFAGEDAPDTEALAEAARDDVLVMPPFVQFELFSGPIPDGFVDLISEATLISLKAGCWADAGRMRRALQTRGLKARAADCLIAQSCIDASVSLITRDRDFRHFADHYGLRLAV